MAVEIVMPRLGWTMEEGVLIEWIKHDGDPVTPGEILFTVESDKALNEVEAFEGGILRIPPDSPPPGTAIKVGGLLAYLVQPGEPAPFEIGAQSGAPIAAQPAMPETVSIPAHHPANDTRARNVPAISPRARRVALELGVDWQTMRGSGRTGRIVERDVRAAAAQVQLPAPVRATPLARRVAHDLNVDLSQVAPEADGKRIQRADVERAATRSQASLPPSVPGTKIPLSGVRRVTAERMAASARTVAPVTLTSEVDATELVQLRKQLKADAERQTRPVPTYTDLLVKLCAQALVEHPALNAQFAEDGVIQADAVHIGIAVDTERGLLVPVLRDAHLKSLRQIVGESRELIQRARTGALQADEMQGSTFTITNLGMYDIDAFTPIVNLPECAILGVGRIVPKQVVIDAEAERLAIRHMMFLSLTFDHRVVDGAPSARFLQRIRQFVEQPYLWLAG
jgi:pyruvate dehydrogenase E2 component (dihydrolipoamide acetyltransferase)